MKLYFIDRKGNRLEKSFTSIPEAMSEVYKAALLGWFVYDEDTFFTYQRKMTAQDLPILNQIRSEFGQWEVKI